MANKLPAVALIAMTERLKANATESAELTAILKEQGVDVDAALANGDVSRPEKKGGMSKAQRKALSEKMKAKHAANKTAKEQTEAGGVAGDAGTAQSAPASAGDGAPAPISFNPAAAESGSGSGSSTPA